MCSCFPLLWLLTLASPAFPYAGEKVPSAHPLFACFFPGGHVWCCWAKKTCVTQQNGENIYEACPSFLFLPINCVRNKGKSRVYAENKKARFSGSFAFAGNIFFYSGILFCMSIGETTKVWIILNVWHTRENAAQPTTIVSFLSPFGDQSTQGGLWTVSIVVVDIVLLAGFSTVGSRFMQTHFQVVAILCKI